MHTSPAPSPTSGLSTAALPIDLYEQEAALLLVASLPGVSREDLEIQLEGEHLSISATRHEPAPTAGEDVVATPIFRELDAVRWTRTLRLRTPVQADAITATLEAGVLTVTLPKAEQARARTIPVT